eukprot:g3718.t1
MLLLAVAVSWLRPDYACGGRLRGAISRARVSPRRPEDECAALKSRNGFREMTHKGCMEHATKAWVSWRKKCKAVAVDAEQRAAEMVMALAAEQERKVSDQLVDAAVAKRQSALDRLGTALEKKKRDITSECTVQGPSLRSDESSECVERLTSEATEAYRLGKAKVDASHESDLKKAAEKAEEKKLQIIAGMTAQRKQAREMVLADCSQYLST